LRHSVVGYTGAATEGWYVWSAERVVQGWTGYCVDVMKPLDH